MSERYVYQERNIAKLMKYYLKGQVEIAEEIRLANITYYEGGELEEPKEEGLAA